LVTGLELVSAGTLVVALGHFHLSVQTGTLLNFLFVLGVTQPWQRRGHLQITARMLEIASHEGATKTALVYKANLNFTLANRYIDYLEKRGLIQGVDGGHVKTYRLTGKGRDALLLLRRTMDEVLEEESMLA
jgi:predicted transcriptional regulator